MTRLNINIGTTANDRTGDPLRTAFDKVNQNFIELYSLASADVQIPSQTGNGGKILTTNGTTLSWVTPASTGDISFNNNNIRSFSGVVVDNSDSTHGPTAAVVVPSNGSLSQPVSLTNIYGDVKINCSPGPGTPKTWRFSADGTLTLPIDGSITSSTSFGIESLISGYTSGVYLDGDQEGSGNAILYATKDAIIRTDNNGVIVPGTFRDWIFGADGFTTFPGGIRFDNGRDIFNPTNNGVNIWDGPYEGPYNGEILLDSNGVIIFTNNELNWWQFKNDGTLEFPDGVGTTSGAIRQRTTRTVTQGYTTVEAGTSGIVFSADSWQTGFKLVITVETRLDNNVDDVDHTQVCEATIAANYNSEAEPAMSVYGLTYTSPNPLATFEIQRGSGTIEVVATNVQTQYNLAVSVHAIQFGSFYD